MRTIQIKDKSGYFLLANRKASIENLANHRCSFLFVKLVVKVAAIPDLSLDLAEFFVDFPTEEKAQPQKTRISVVNEGALEELREKNHNKNTIKSTRTWLKVFDAWRVFPA